MGSVNTIGIDTYPKQSKFLGRSVEILFNYDTSDRIRGVIVRDDREEPFRTIFKLNDGRYVLSTECQYGIL